MLADLSNAAAAAGHPEWYILLLQPELFSVITAICGPGDMVVLMMPVSVCFCWIMNIELSQEPTTPIRIKPVSSAMAPQIILLLL